MRSLVANTSAAIVALVVLACLTAYWYLRQSLPVVDGNVSASGISSPVDIIRDADAIPHVYASTTLDALFGLGYVHAQDRLWQMEMQRRIGHGRLSEIFGSPTIPQDRFLRTVGFGRAARSAWAKMTGRAKQEVNAYVAGVNAFIATHHGRQLPPEFTLLQFEPESWDGADVVVWVKMLAWDLSGNYSLELLRHDLVARVGLERMRELMPPSARDGLSILAKGATTGATDTNGGHGSGSKQSSAASVDRDTASVSSVVEHSSVVENSWTSALGRSLSRGVPAVRDLLLGGATTEALGSNNWVVDGTLSATGKPLLANDPHLGTKVPSTWYLAHLSAGDFDVIGATLPGTPAVALGRNRFIAWGATNVAADVEDLYRERLDAPGRLAEFRGVQEPLTVLDETIGVKGSQPVHAAVRISRHGPLISDAINANNAELRRGPKPPPLEPLAFRWTALDSEDTTLASFLKVNEARNWTDFTSALRDFVVPSQNFVYADVDGHIGYYAPGRIPIRSKGDGGLPAEGWTGDAEWTGWIPFDRLPHAADPPEHFYVTANNRPAPAGDPFVLGLDWPEPYRAQRITDLLTGSVRLPLGGPQGRQADQDPHKFTPDDFAHFQADTVSLHARKLLPMLVPRVHPHDASDRQALEIARQWNADARGDSAGTAIFEAWFLQLAPALVSDRLGPIVTANYQGRYSFVTRFITNVLASQDSVWCDEAATAKRETCDEAVTKAFHTAVADLTRRVGDDMTRWRWDAVHRAVFPHQGLDTVAGLGRFLSRSVPNGGDWSTIDVGPVSADHLYEQHSVAGYRQIIDLSPANDSRFLDAVGESGHPLSPHYDDFLHDWQAVKHRRMRMERADVEAGALGRLRLTPSQF